MCWAPLIACSGVTEKGGQKSFSKHMGCSSVKWFCESLAGPIFSGAYENIILTEVMKCKAALTISLLSLSPWAQNRDSVIPDLLFMYVWPKFPQNVFRESSGRSSLLLWCVLATSSAPHSTAVGSKCAHFGAMKVDPNSWILLVVQCVKITFTIILQMGSVEGKHIYLFVLLFNTLSSPVRSSAYITIYCAQREFCVEFQ